MQNINYPILQKVSLFLLLLFCPFWANSQNEIIQHLKFKQLSTLNGLPTDEVQKVFQDKDG